MCVSRDHARVNRILIDQREVAVARVREDLWELTRLRPIPHLRYQCASAFPLHAGLRVEVDINNGRVKVGPRLQRLVGEREWIAAR